MKTLATLLLPLALTATLCGCAGQTTDPRQGGLFSYNPDAYEQRLRNRQEHLTAVEQATESEQMQAADLEDEQAALGQEKAALQRRLRKLSATTASLEKEVRAKQTRTAAQNKERQRILAELGTIKASTRTVDAIDDPEGKRLELERLKAKQDKLEKEAANLMRL